MLAVVMVDRGGSIKVLSMMPKYLRGPHVSTTLWPRHRLRADGTYDDSAK